MDYIIIKPLVFKIELLTNYPSAFELYTSQFSQELSDHKSFEKKIGSHIIKNDFVFL